MLNFYPARIPSRLLRGHELVEFCRQTVFFHHAEERLAVLSDACAGATHVSCDVGVAVVIAFLTDFQAGFEVLAQLGRILDGVAEDLDCIFPVVVVFDAVVVGDPLENFHHAGCFGGAFGAGAAFQGEVHEFFALAAFGVVALFGGEEPAALLGGVGDERNAQGRVECGYGVVEQVVGIAQQAVLTFLGAVALEAEV